MKTIRGMILGAALFVASGVGLLALADEPKPKPPEKAAVDAVEKMADDAGTKDWAEFTKAGAGIAKKVELVDVMNLLRKRDTKVGVIGLGIGAKPGKITPDGIEAKIINMSKVPMAQATLNRDGADLIRMAERVAAIASVAAHQCPVEAKQGKKDPANWKKWSGEMFKNSQDLIGALKKKDPKAVKEAANRLNGVCNECHSDFKD